MFYRGTTIPLLFFLVVQLNLSTASQTLPKPERQYSQEHVCNIIHAMLQNVTHCPHNNDTLQERSWKKMCHTFPKCKGETLVYHCVKYKNNLVEVCAPKGLITGRCCAMFDYGVGRVIEDYDKLCSECPFNYNSTESFFYPTCVHLLNKPKLKNATISKTTEVTDVISSNKPWSSTQTTKYSDVSARNNDKTMNQTRSDDIFLESVVDVSSEDKYSSVYIIIGIIIGIIVMLISGLTLKFWVQRRLLRRHSNQPEYIYMRTRS